MHFKGFYKYKRIAVIQKKLDVDMWVIDRFI